MRSMKFTEKEKAILAGLNSVGTGSLAALADAANLKTHAVRYGLENLLERGILSPFCSIDASTLGFNSYIAYFSLPPTPREEAERALSSIVSHPNVSWIGELSGAFQYGCTVCAKNVYHALALFDEIAVTMKIPWQRKMFAQRTALTFWPLKFFGRDDAQPVCVEYPALPARCEIDDLDHKILKLKNDSPTMSHSEIARICGQPVSTIAYRIQQLIENKVIIGSWYIINWGRMGIAHSEVSLVLKRLDTSLLKRLVSFGRECRSCYFVVGGVGAWDFQFNVLTEHQDELHRFISDLRTSFGHEIDEVAIHAYTRLFKFSNYPFKDLATVVADT
jgi:DNA-binding Lrp family transcriptional regulator